MPGTLKIDLTGALEPDGAVLFQGVLLPNERESTSAEMRLHVRTDANRGLVGEVNFTWRWAGVPDQGPFDGWISSASLGTVLPPTGPPPSLVAGTWTGTASIESCTGFPCGATGIEFHYVLVLRDAGAGAVTPLFGYWDWVADLTGTLLPDGSALLSGSYQPVEPSSDSRVDVTRLVVRTDASGGLGGSFEFVTSRHGIRPFNATRTAAILTGSRQDVTFSPGDFHGFFEGQVAVTQCLAGDCNATLPQNDVTFTFAQASSSVIGTTMIWNSDIPSLELAGAAVDGTLHVSGERFDRCAPRYDEHQVCSQHIRNFSATIDELGRLHGSFEYSRDAYLDYRHYGYTVMLEFRTVFKR